MEIITQLSKINYLSYMIATCILFIAFKGCILALEWIINFFGIETKWMKETRKEHELLMQTSQNLIALQEKHEKDIARSDQRDEEISCDIKKLTQMFVDKEIDDMRWEINDFATKVSEGKPYNKDSFKHCIHVYEKYEQILEENGLENGEIELSMELINDTYKRKLKEGF